MKASEQRKAEFLKPKKGQMFGRKEYKSVKQGKVLGFTASDGRMLFVMCPSPWSTTEFARLVRTKVGPLLRAAFPDKARVRILLDSEPLLHTSQAKAAFAEHGLEVMPDWPKYSPDLNPQEHVWSWVERALRKEERKSDTFQVFTRKLLVVARRYPSAAAFMPSMHGRVQEVLRCKGAMTKY